MGSGKSGGALVSIPVSIPVSVFVPIPVSVSVAISFVAKHVNSKIKELCCVRGEGGRKRKGSEREEKGGRDKMDRKEGEGGKERVHVKKGGREISHLGLVELHKFTN